MIVGELVARARRSVLACGSSIALVAAIGFASASLGSEGSAVAAPMPVLGPSSIQQLIAATQTAAPVRPKATRVARSARRPAAYRGADGKRITEVRIRRFLRRYGSPMAPHSREILRAGIRYRVDPRVIVAIAGVESSFGIYAPGHNAWGWGHKRWGSWRSAVHSYTRALARAYPSLRVGHFSRAVHRYCPPCTGRWVARASWFFRSI